MSNRQGRNASRLGDESAHNVSGNRSHNSTRSYDGSSDRLTSGISSSSRSAHEVGRYVQSRARSVQRKKEKRSRKKTSLSPTRLRTSTPRPAVATRSQTYAGDKSISPTPPIRRNQTMEVASLGSWRNQDRERIAQPARERKLPARCSSIESVGLDEDEESLRYAASKYVRAQSTPDMFHAKPLAGESSQEQSQDSLAKAIGQQFKDEMEDSESFAPFEYNIRKSGLVAMTKQVQKNRVRKRKLTWLILGLAGIAICVIFIFFVQKSKGTTSRSASSIDATALSVTEVPHDGGIKETEEDSSKLDEPLADGNKGDTMMPLQLEDEEVATEGQPRDEALEEELNDENFTSIELPVPPEEAEEYSSGYIRAVCAGSGPASGGQVSLSDVSQECRELCEENVCCWHSDGVCDEKSTAEQCAESTHDFLLETCSFLNALRMKEDEAGTYPYQLAFPPADDHALSVYCDNSDETFQADGYLECERLCMVAACCWKEDSPNPCTDEHEECAPYSLHCFVLNDSEISYQQLNMGG